MISQLKGEKDVILDEKYHYIQEADQYKQKLRESESSILERIKQLQDTTTREKERYILEQENKFKELKDKFEKQILSIRNEYNGLVSDREKQIDGLMSHLKSFTDTQHITLNENEKLKITNEKFKMEQSGIDQKTNELNGQHKKEMDEIKVLHKKEKDLLVESYNETIKKSQELNDALQNRLNQTIEALGLSKTAISNLKETNQNLEKQIQTKESEDSSYQDKYNQSRSENMSLREKLERSIELNNSYSNKEKQYESQIKQLQSKYSQLVNLTKKGMNSVTQ
jgi:chromosome segregation ATPase